MFTKKLWFVVEKSLLPLLIAVPTSLHSSDSWMSNS